MTTSACRLAARDPRSPQIYQSLADLHFPRRRWTRGRQPAEVELDGRWYLDANRQATEMVRVATRDFTRFLAESFGVRLSNRHTGRFPITVRVAPVGADGTSSSKRAHELHVTREGIGITAASEWGAACGLYHLQRLLRLAQAPRLPVGILRAAPALEPSLTYLPFKTGNNNALEFPTAYPAGCLLRIARAGYTGYHLDLSINLFAQSQILPGLNQPHAARHRAILRRIVNRSRAHALEVFVTFYVQLWPAQHPVFRKHAGVKGSAIVGTGGQHILCSSHPLVRRFYEEQAAQLVRDAAGLGGLILIVGCEGLLHCYTAPASRPRHQTDCPRCGRRDPERTVAAMVNGMARAVKQVNPEARVVVWPYCSATWTKTSDARDLIARLSPDCDLMGNFDTGDRCVREGVSATVCDYSLTQVGPSADFQSQVRTGQRRGLRTMAKLESGCPREIHNVPSIPANTRWTRKYENVLKSGVTGAMFAWEFTGYTEEIAGELAGWMSWRPCPPAEKLLPRIAARDFGARNTTTVLAAWRCFDRAMDFFPFSGSVTHFARGPFFIGFTHPLILDPHRLGELSPQFWLDSTRMQFHVDLQWTHPFGAAKCLRSLGKMERWWSRGSHRLERAVSPGGNNPYAAAKLVEHQALGQALLCTLRTAINLIRFYLVRDQYAHEASNLRLVRRRLTALRRIAKEELANAREGLACMQRNNRIGHDYVNGFPFTEEMAKSKIAHTRKLIDEVLPLRMFGHSFIMFSRDEWLGDDGQPWR